MRSWIAADVRPPSHQGDEAARVGTALVVLGYHEIDPLGQHGISDICRAGIAKAGRLVERDRPQVVVFTGWTSCGGPSEAEQMARIWSDTHDDPPIVLEPYAANTAENATRVLAILRKRDDIGRVVVVCSIRHVVRVWILFRDLYRRSGLRVRLAVVLRPFPGRRILAAELGGITRMRGDRRRAIAAFERGDHEPMSGPRGS